MYEIEYTHEAEADLLYYRKREQQIIVSAIESASASTAYDYGQSVPSKST
jgi:hypothetical protein